MKTKSSVRLVQLQAAHSKVGQQAIHRSRAATCTGTELNASPISVTLRRLAA